MLHFSQEADYSAKISSILWVKKLKQANLAINSDLNTVSQRARN